jgi:hypothetical protein
MPIGMSMGLVKAVGVLVCLMPRDGWASMGGGTQRRGSMGSAGAIPFALLPGAEAEKQEKQGSPACQKEVHGELLLLKLTY